MFKRNFLITLMFVCVFFIIFRRWTSWHGGCPLKVIVAEKVLPPNLQQQQFITAAPQFFFHTFHWQLPTMWKTITTACLFIWKFLVRKVIASTFVANTPHYLARFVYLEKFPNMRVFSFFPLKALTAHINFSQEPICSESTCEYLSNEAPPALVPFMYQEKFL